MNDPKQLVDRYIAIWNESDPERRRQGVAELWRLGDIVKFRWEMVTDSGEVAGIGLEFVVLGADGRIQTDYQFIEG